MILQNAMRGTVIRMGLLVALASGMIFVAGYVSAQQTKLDILRIGASGSMTGNKEKDKGAMDTLKAFIKDETGLDNALASQKGWRGLAKGMAQGQFQIGVFQGYEFAWAVEGDPKLKPLAIAVNTYTYPVVYVIVSKNHPARGFAGLKGQTLTIAVSGQGIFKLFVERQAELAASNLRAFFSNISEPDNFEDALDDVVDGKTQATVVDRAALEAFKNRKPARFNKLRPAAQSQPLPPPVVAFYEGKLDEATLDRFKQGLLNASLSERGQTLLSLFHLTNFDAVPSDFGQVLAAARKAYPPPPK
jgi:ABC-type phosphate/phosphonate transport system substrate-binding protein